MDSRKRAVILAACIIGASVGVGVWLLVPRTPVEEAMADRLESVFTAPDSAALGDVFDQAVRAQVPLEYLFQVARNLTTYYGAFQRVVVCPTPNSNGYHNYTAVLARANLTGTASLGTWNQRLDGWFASRAIFHPAYLTRLAWTDVVTELEALPGTSALLVERGGVVLARANETQRLAVGSTYKLFVLRALLAKIATDPAVTWDTRVALRQEWKSLPSGILQADAYPPGTEFSLRELANLMINISDNTAADHLVYFLSREHVEAFLPTGYPKPFLTSSEVFKLRYLVPATNLTRYLQMTEGERRAYLAGPFAMLNASAIDVLAIDWHANLAARSQLEWFFTAREVVEGHQAVRTEPATRMNPGLADPGLWNQTSFKGGSDAGVFALSHAVQARNGTWCHVVVTVNNPEGFDLAWGQNVAAQEGYMALAQLVLQKLRT